MRQRSMLLRRSCDKLFSSSAILATMATLFILVIILAALTKFGFSGLSLSLFTQATPAPGESGGLYNAIIGSIMITVLAIVAATPIGILIATYLVEFSHKNRLAQYLRFINDIMLSSPSIVTGLFVYILLVQTMGHFSGLSGSVALMIIAIPIITRTTEDVLYLVSPMLREAALALGVPRWRVTLSIVYKAARQGIITGVLLALARIMGETAPLLFTALNNQFTSYNMWEPMSNLPTVIYRFAMSPYSSWQNLAWAGSLLITVAILIINLIARYMAREKH